jgi:hypothetical protein
MLTFTMEMDASVEATSREELETAARKLIDSGGLRDWSGEWEHSIWETPKADARDGPLRSDCGVADGKILEYDDYLKALRGD